MPKFSLVAFFIALFSHQSVLAYNANSSVKTVLDIFREMQNATQLNFEESSICVAVTEKYYQQLRSVSAKQVNLNELKEQDLGHLINESFSLRLKIKELMKPLVPESQTQRRCFDGIAQIVLALRYFEDYLLELQYKGLYGNKLRYEEFESLEGTGSHLLINPKFKDVFKGVDDLQSGDIIISRGTSNISASIARIAKNDSQFSHVILVKRDKNGRLFTTESHIEVGNINAPIKALLDYGNARLVVLRQKDKKLGELAAQLMWDKVQAAQMSGNNIPYDFAMDFKDDSKYFCSEVAYWGYKLAAKQLYGAKYEIPMVRSKFTEGRLPFLRQVGVGVNKSNIDTFTTFAPGDMQFDPRFDIVAEFRHPLKLRESRIRDAVLSKMFQWMETKDYRFVEDVGIMGAIYGAWLMRRSRTATFLINILSGFDLADQFSIDMSRSQLRLIAYLHMTADLIFEQVAKVQVNREVPLTFTEIEKIIEDYRVEDYKKWLNWQIWAQDPPHLRSKKRQFKRFSPQLHVKYRPL